MDNISEAFAALAPLITVLPVLIAGRSSAGAGLQPHSSARWIAAAGLAVSLGASLLSLSTPIGHIPMVLFAALALVTVLVLPRQDCTPREIARLLFVAAGTQTVYAANNEWLLFAGYLAATLPFFDRRRPLGSILLAASGVLLAAAIGSGAFWLLAGAIALGKGLFPFQSTITSLFERKPLGTAALLFNAHLGAFLLMRLRGASAVEWFPVVGMVALAPAVFTAFIALIETQPRRILALVVSSQAACILAGLATSTAQGVQGALMQWVVVGLASTGMLAVYRLIEVRYGAAITGRDFLGLAERFPRLAVFFAVCALAMVGLPGTLGFLAEDLLIQGLLESHSYVGMLQPLAAALNAFTLLRLFSTLFLGRRAQGLEIIPDALPRERWPLAALVVLLVIGGLAPGYVIAAWSGHVWLRPPL